MSDPLIVVTTARIKDGTLDDYKQFHRSISELVQANETRIIGFRGFLNEERTEATLVQVHTDTASMEFHVQVLADNWDESFSKYSQMLEVLRRRLRDTPERVLAMDRQLGITFSVEPGPMPGFVLSGRPGLAVSGHSSRDAKSPAGEGRTR